MQIGVPDRNRTCDVPLRRRTLYPAEVRRHKYVVIAFIITDGSPSGKPLARHNTAVKKGGQYAQYFYIILYDGTIVNPRTHENTDKISKTTLLK